MKKRHSLWAHNLFKVGIAIVDTVVFMAMEEYDDDDDVDDEDDEDDGDDGNLQRSFSVIIRIYFRIPSSKLLTDPQSRNWSQPIHNHGSTITESVSADPQSQIHNRRSSPRRSTIADSAVSSTNIGASPLPKYEIQSSCVTTILVSNKGMCVT